MPIPLVVLGITTVAGIIGAKKTADGVSKTKEADRIKKKAERICEMANENVEREKEKTSKAIQRLGERKIKLSGTEIKDFIESFSQIKIVNSEEKGIVNELEKLTIGKENMLSEMEKASIEAQHLLSSGASGIGAGVLLGWGTYGGVMALGTASTGAAIGTLSGAAATNATLAWLGGGAIAAGGGGMALGTAVLGGIVAGPAILIAGGLFNSKASEKLEKAKANLKKAEKADSDAKNGIVELKHIASTANQIIDFLYEIKPRINRANFELKRIVRKKTEWSQFTDEEKHTVAATLKLAQLLKEIIDTPLLNENGFLTREAKKLIQNKKKEEF